MPVKAVISLLWWGWLPGPPEGGHQAALGWRSSQFWARNTAPIPVRTGGLPCLSHYTYEVIITLSSYKPIPGHRLAG